jgi:L-aspartate semialdehyde sulfurtransferase ferredoxin
MVVTRMVRLAYPRELLKKPVLNQLIRDFDLMTNILQADVRAHSGCIILEIRGEEEIVENALAWLSAQGVTVHVLTKDEELACDL